MYIYIHNHDPTTTLFYLAGRRSSRRIAEYNIFAYIFQLPDLLQYTIGSWLSTTTAAITPTAATLKETCCFTSRILALTHLLDTLAV